MRRIAILPRWTQKLLILSAAALAAGLASCASLPQVTPEEVSASTVKVQSARGVLPPNQAKAVLSRLESRSPETNIFDRHLALEQQVASSPLTIDNRVTLFQDGESTYRSMYRVLGTARDSINMETYIIEDDEIGNRFADLLIEKQKQGVQVALIYDSVGSLRTPKTFFDRMRDAGIKVLEFNPVNPLEARKGWEVNQRDHRKLLIVDGQAAYLGGINISSVYSSGSSGSRGKRSGSETAQGEVALPWRDTHILVEGPVVAEFQKFFLDTWKKQKGEALALPETRYFPPRGQGKGREVVRAIASSSDDGGGQMYNTLLSAINSAETSAYLTNAYFAPDEKILVAMKAAVARGVDVKIILPGKTDSALIFHAGRSYYADLLKHGVKIYERRSALLHAKTAIIDGVWSTIGSTNLDWRSFLHNDEVNAVVLGPEFAAQMQAMFEKDLAASDLITLDQWRHRSLTQRLKESAARLWAYWL